MIVEGWQLLFITQEQKEVTWKVGESYFLFFKTWWCLHTPHYFTL